MGEQLQPRAGREGAHPRVFLQLHVLQEQQRPRPRPEAERRTDRRRSAAALGKRQPRGVRQDQPRGTGVRAGLPEPPSLDRPHLRRRPAWQARRRGEEHLLPPHLRGRRQHRCHRGPGAAAVDDGADPLLRTVSVTAVHEAAPGAEDAQGGGGVGVRQPGTLPDLWRPRAQVDSEANLRERRPPGSGGQHWAVPHVPPRTGVWRRPGLLPLAPHLAHDAALRSEHERQADYGRARAAPLPGGGGEQDHALLLLLGRQHPPVRAGRLHHHAAGRAHAQGRSHLPRRHGVASCGRQRLPRWHSDGVARGAGAGTAAAAAAQAPLCPPRPHLRRLLPGGERAPGRGGERWRGRQPGGAHAALGQVRAQVPRQRPPPLPRRRR
mmetsp:Transcript_22205/g.87462  ORF Transcript_22205/g.87462 Transcript_22205/m.87462 type:complete len:379 (-) Transcript_22205:382-1518(-)